MKQKERSFSCSYILIPLLFTLYTAEIHHHIFIKYYLQFIYLSFEHNHIIISQYIIILSSYQYIIISSLSKIIIISENHHIILKQNHHIIIIKQNHYIIFKQNHHIIIIISYKIITGEIILNYRRIIKKKLSLIIGSTTHPDPLCTNQFSIKNC